MFYINNTENESFQWVVFIFSQVRKWENFSDRREGQGTTVCEI